MLVDPIYVAYRVTAEDETKWAVRRVCPNQSGGGASGMHTKHMKRWIAAVQAEENPDTFRWRIIMEIIQL